MARGRDNFNIRQKKGGEKERKRETEKKLNGEKYKKTLSLSLLTRS